MSTYEDIKLGLKEWINNEIFVTVVFSENSDVRPSRLPYATIRFDTQNSYGIRDEQKQVNDEGIVEIRGHRSLTVDINMYGSGSIQKMEDLKSSLSKETVLSNLNDKYGIAILDKGAIQNLSTLMETKYEERAQMDVLIGYATSIEDEVGIIERVEINEEIIDL